MPGVFPMKAEFTRSAFSINASTPLMVELVEHAMLGVGPKFSTELTASGESERKTTAIGLAVSLLVWL